MRERGKEKENWKGQGMQRMRLFGAAMIAMLTLLGEPAQALAQQSDKPSARLTVQASPSAVLSSSMPLDANEWLHAIAEGVVYPLAYAPVSDTYLTVNERTYLVDPSYRLYDMANASVIQLSGERKQQLIANVSALKAKHYGKLLSWPEAKAIITMKSTLAVVDLETGMRFEVQRRAGSTHADVQPLTKQDTEVMKRIYEGKWSWRRRAILAVKDGQAIAASMHGMPHGGDGIPDNDFDGHFCIHFLGSSTHKTGSIDPDHQAMVYKAAGKLPQYMQRAEPDGIVELFFIAINQRDPEIMSAIFPYRNHARLERLRQDAAGVLAIRRVSDYKADASPDLLAIDIPARAVIYRDGFRKTEKTLVFQLRRSSLSQPWTIDEVENAL